MVLFAWLIAIAGLGGGSWIIYRKFIAPKQSLWEGMGDWFASKDVSKAEKRKEGKVGKAREDILKELKVLHSEDSEMNLIINLLEKNELTIAEGNQLVQLIKSELEKALKEFQYINDGEREFNNLQRLIDAENKRVGKKVSQEIRVDWSKEYEAVTKLLEEIVPIKDVARKDIKNLNGLMQYIEKTLNQAKAGKKENFLLDKSQTKDIIVMFKESSAVRKKIIQDIYKKVEEIQKLISKEQGDITTQKAA